MDSTPPTCIRGVSSSIALLCRGGGGGGGGEGDNDNRVNERIVIHGQLSFVLPTEFLLLVSQCKLQI